MDNAPSSTSPNRYDSSSAPEDQFQPQTQTQTSQFNSSLPEVHNSYFSKLYELARFHFDSANYFQGLFNIDKCIEHLLTNLEDGNQSPVLQDFISKIVSDLNELALNLLKADKPHECLRILEKCKEYTTPDKYGNFSRLRSLTYNHIGCCYRRLGNLEKALYYLQKVLILVEPADRIEILGITHINLCAVLSQMNNHKKALEQARLAVSECAYDLIHANNATGSNKQSDVKKKATMLAIAYHNLGIEESFCNDEDAALQAYFKAYKLVEEHSGVEDKLYEKFKQAHDMTLEKIMRENKTNKPKKRMPSLSKRKKGKLSPKNWYIKRAPSYSTNALAAKVYLQNGRVVVPDFKDYKTQIEENRNQSSRSRSKSNRPLSSKTQTNSSSIIKPMAPIGTKPRLKKKQRPFTAVSQGNRFSSGEPSKMSIKTSHKNLYDSGDQFIQEDDGPSGDDDSELEKFVLEDEQELQWINMKSNRLAFLSDLNQFGNSRQSVQTTDPRVEKTFNPRSPNESLRSPPNTDGFRSHTDMKSQSDGFRTQSDKFYPSSDVQENSPEFVTSSNPFTQPPPSKKSQSFNEKKPSPTLEPSASKLSFKIDGSSNKSSPFSKISERSDDWSPDSVMKKTNEKNAIHPKSTHHQNHSNLEYIEDSSLEAKESATLLQNHYKDAQKKSHRESADSERVFKVLAKTVNSTFEKRLAGKGSLPYFILMMYNWDEEYISVQVKNLQTSKLFKSVVKYQRKCTDNSPTKEAVEEIREYCESLLERLSIIDGCIVFAEDRQVIGSYIESKLDDKSKESKLMASPSEEKLANQPKAKPKVVIDIPESLSTPRASDTEIRPLLTGSHRVGAKSFEVRPKSTKSDAQSSREFMKGFPLHESVHYQTTPKGSSGIKPPSDRRKNVRPFSGMAKVASKDHLEHRRPKAPSDVESEGYDSMEGKKVFPPQPQKGSSFKQNPKFDSGRRKEESNYRVVFADNAEVQGHELEFKISEKINEHPEDFSTYRLACFDKDTGKNIKGLDIPRNSLKIKDLTAQGLLGFIEVDLRNGELYFKNEQSFNGNHNKPQTDEEEEDEVPKPLFAKKPLRIESPTDVEESIPDSKSLTASPETNKKKTNDQNAPDPRRTSYQSDEENTFRIKPLINRGSRYVEESPEREQLLQLDFGRGKSIDCFVSHDKKKNKVIVKYLKSDGPDGNDDEKTLSLRGETLGVPIQGFPPGSFEENMKNLLTSKLILRDGDLVLGDQKNQSNISIKEREEIDEEIPEDAPQKQEDLNIEVKPLINRGGLDFSRDNKQSEDDGSSSKEIRPMINKGYNDSARKRRYVANPTPRSANQQQANRMSLGKTTLNEVELMNEAMNINEAFKDRRGTLGNLKTTQGESNQEIEEELPDLNAEDVQAATLKIQKAYLNKKKNKEPKEVIKPLIAPTREGSKKKIPTEPAEEEIQEDLPDLKDPEVQNATLAIQKAYLRKKNNHNKPHPPAPIVKKPVSEQPVPQPKPEPDDDDLPDLKDKDVQKATLSIQKAYKKRLEKKKEEPKPLMVVPPPKQEEPEDELPDLNAKDVQDATMKIQNAYLRKKKNQGQAPKIPHNKAPEQHKVVALIAEVKKPIMPIVMPPKQEEPKDEMPDLNAKDVQDATMKIQNAYLKKKQNREKAKNDPPKVDIPPQQQTTHPIKVEEDDDELPDLNAKDVQDATMKIQNAYLRKKNKKQAPSVQQPKVVKEETPKLPPPQPKEDDDELPDLNAKDVQDATMKIQNAYLRKKKAKAQPPAKPKEEEPEFKPLIAPVKKPEPQPAEEEEELPDIKDPEVQNATLAIQKAYLKKKNRNKPAAQEPSVKKREDDLAKDFPIQKGYLAKKDGKFVQVAGGAEKNDDDELPDLNAKDVQDATMKIQKAYIKRKQNKKPAQLEEKVQSEPAKEEEKEELPNLEDPDVQKSTLAIQKAYMKRKARQQQKQEPVKKEENKPQAKTEEEEEMPNLEDPDVQKSTLAIQKAYMKRKARQQQKQEPVKKEEPKPQPPAKEEEEELPNLEDPEVQKSTLAIQKAYMKRKARQQQKQELAKKEEPKPQEEEEMPNLEDPDVQKSTLAIQKAYMKRKARQQQKQELAKKEEPKPQEEEEMPNLEDPDVQKSTLAIQKAYMKRKARQQQKQEQEQAKTKVEEPPAAAEEELPDIHDPEVQNATFAIQKAYKNRMEKLKKSRPPPQEEPKQQEQIPVTVTATAEEEEELPNIEDPEVQKATLAIQKAYKKRLHSKLGHSPIKERASEEDKATGESNSENEHDQEARDQVVLDHGRQALPESVKRSHIKPHTVTDHLNDEADSPDSGSAGKKPGASHYKTSWRNHRSYTGEIPKIVIHTEEENSLNNNDLQEYIQTDPSDNPYVELISYSHPRHNGFEVTDLHRYEKDDTIEEDSDLPNLEDPDVQRAAASIQRAYMQRSKKKAAV